MLSLTISIQWRKYIHNVQNERKAIEEENSHFENCVNIFCHFLLPSLYEFNIWKNAVMATFQMFLFTLFYLIFFMNLQKETLPVELFIFFILKSNFKGDFNIQKGTQINDNLHKIESQCVRTERSIINEMVDKNAKKREM